MLNSKIKNIILYALIALSIIIIGAIVFYYQKYDVIAGDDIWQIFFINPILEEILKPDHGRYLAWMQMKLVGSAIPMALNIHPQDFAPIGGSLFKAIGISMLCFVFSIFMFLKRKINFLFPLLLFYTFFYYFSLIKAHNLAEVTDYSPFYGYSFALGIYALFWIIIIQNYVNKKEFNPLLMIGCCIIAFFAGVNDAYTTQILLSLCCLGIFILINSKNEALAGIKNIWKIKYIPVFLITTIIGYIGVYSDKHVINFVHSGQNESNFLQEIIRLLPSFLPDYLEAVILNHLTELVIISLLIITIKILSKDTETTNKIIFISLSMIFGFFIFFFGLIIGGNNTFYVAGKFWIEHVDLQLGFVMALYMVILLLTGFLLKTIENNKKAYYAISILLAIFMTSQILSGSNIYNQFKNDFSLQKQARSEMYKNEKMYLFYALKNQKAILSNKSLANPFIASAYFVGIVSDMPEGQIETLEDFERQRGCYQTGNCDELAEKISKITFYDTFYNSRYIKSVYKDITPVEYSFVPDKQAVDTFKKNGGSFENLEIENPKFQNLYNKDFVLNKSK